MTAAFISMPLSMNADINEERAKLQQEMNAFRKAAKEDLESFRQKINKEYAEALKDPWNNIKVSPPIVKPKEEQIPPVIIDDENTDPLPIKPNPVPYDEIFDAPRPTPQPQPIEPIHEIVNDPIPINPLDDTPEPSLLKKLEFSFFGTPVSVRIPTEPLFRLKHLEENEVSNVWDKLSSDNYTNLLYDCLQLRDNLKLDDWPYLLLLQQVGEEVCGKGTNESVILTAYLYCQSGYKMRLAFSKNQLRMLFASDHTIFDNGYCMLDGTKFYLLGGGDGDLSISEKVFPNEQNLSLLMNHQPLLALQSSPASKHISTRNTDMDISINANTNLLKLYDTYPASIVNDNFMTKWSMYANMPMPEHIKKQLYPKIKEKIQGLDKLQALNKILNWVQTGFEYEYDDIVWGGDRAFFPEESLHYPYCDCEDRSILLSRIVRDVLNLQCVLVYYPSHLAAAVAIDEGNPTGDYFDYKGKRFFIADGTIMGYGASVGQTMKNMDNSKATLILLD